MTLKKEKSAFSTLVLDFYRNPFKSVAKNSNTDVP